MEVRRERALNSVMGAAGVAHRRSTCAAQLSRPRAHVQTSLQSCKRSCSCLRVKTSDLGADQVTALRRGEARRQAFQVCWRPHEITRPAATSSSLAARSAISWASPRISSVSISDSYSACDITTAEGRPFRVITTCSWTRSISSSSSVKWVRASVKGRILATAKLYTILISRRRPGTRTRTGYATWPSSVRVYGFAATIAAIRRWAPPKRTSARPGK